MQSSRTPRAKTTYSPYKVSKLVRTSPLTTSIKTLTNVLSAQLAQDEFAHTVDEPSSSLASDMIQDHLMDIDFNLVGRKGKLRYKPKLKR